MLGFKNWYLKWKLLALNFVVVVVFSIISIFATQHMVKSLSNDILESNLSNILSSTINQIETIRRINPKEVQNAQGLTRIVREIENGLGQTSIHGGGMLTVLDANSGQWIIHPTAKGQNWSSKHDFIKKIMDTGNGTVYFEMNDSEKKHSAVYQSYKPLNWIVAAVAPVESASGVLFTFGFNSVAIFFFSMVIYAFFTYLISEKMIIKPLRNINEAFRTGTKGNLDVVLKKQYNDEIGEMTDNFNEFMITLKSIIFSIRNTAENILNSSNEISGGNNQLSSATQQMASSLEETAASVEQISASIHETAEISVILTDNITLTAARADKGKEHLRQMEKAINQVKESGTRISEIVDMVNSIAFHTNLLALNAAVEAARAGEQGKGFAVVASEIRTLAQRSADAASEIKQLVDSNEDLTTNAGTITKVTSQILMDVVTNIQNNASEMRDIEGRSKEQSKGIKQINSAIMQMDEVTQRNAALVEELASSAMDMAAISKSLNDEVLRFKLSENESFVHTRALNVTPETQVKTKKADPFSVGFDEKKAKTFEDTDFDSNSFLDDDQFEEF